MRRKVVAPSSRSESVGAKWLTDAGAIARELNAKEHAGRAVRLRVTTRGARGSSSAVTRSR